MALADRIRRELRERGMTQKDLAHQAGVSERSISNLLSGRDSNRWPPSAAAVEMVFDWEPGTARRLVDADTPTTTDTVGPVAPTAPADRATAYAADQSWKIPIDEARELVLRFDIGPEFRRLIEGILDVADPRNHP